MLKKITNILSSFVLLFILATNSISIYAANDNTFTKDDKSFFEDNGVYISEEVEDFFNDEKRSQFEDSFLDHSSDIIYIDYTKGTDSPLVTVEVNTPETKRLFEKFENGTATPEEKDFIRNLMSGKTTTIPTSEKIVEVKPFAEIYYDTTNFKHNLPGGSFGSIEYISVDLEYQVSPKSPVYTEFTNISYDVHSSRNISVSTSYSGKNAYLKATYNGKTLQQIVYRLSNSGSVSHSHR